MAWSVCVAMASARCERPSGVPKSMSRGMTLLEVLVSLVLLSALSLASLAWTRVARELGSSVQPLSWMSAAENVLEQVGLDLTTGDFEPAEDEKDPRVSVTDKSVLRI